MVYRVGLIVNPMAGIGGAVGLKGSDGDAVVAQALARGALPRSGEKAGRCLKVLERVKEQLHFVCCPGAMGADLLSSSGFSYSVLDLPQTVRGEREQWSAKDTERAVNLLWREGVDLILFAGGDGTARNIFDALDGLGAAHRQVVLGIPAGVKIHSSVYGVTPEAAGGVVQKLVTGEIVSLVAAEVRDIDEDAFRSGRVSTRFYGELQVPVEAVYMQHVKNSGREVEALVLQDIAADVVESMEDGVYYVFAPGSTTMAVTDLLHVDATLLGVDVVLDEALVAKDVIESQLYELVANHKTKLVITVIGGQGHLLGRGNQQLSPRVIRAIGKENIVVIATKSKLQELGNRPLLVDSGDPQLDKAFNGFIPVVTGYEDTILYPVGVDVGVNCQNLS